MQINSTNQIDCCKPKRKNFTGGSENNSPKGKVRYKHFEQMNDDVLKVRSIVSAHREIEKSGKMQVFKAIPAITTGLIGLSISLTQPGRLSSKLTSGLGFLALVKMSSLAFDKIDNFIDKKYQKNNDTNEAKKSIEKIGSYFVAAAGIFGAIAGVKKLGATKQLEPLTSFISKESKTLAKEINSTKLSNFVDNNLNPFMQRHKDTNMTLSMLSPLASIGLGTLASVKMSESLSKDIKEKAEYNFEKAKLVQSMAKEHFDSIDAIEV